MPLVVILLDSDPPTKALKYSRLGAPGLLERLRADNLTRPPVCRPEHQSPPTFVCQGNHVPD